MRLNPLYDAMGDTIFDEMSMLARRTGAINLGQGFPEAQGPEALRRAAAEAIVNGNNQYPPMRGAPALREAVARHYGAHQDVQAGPENVVVTSGATEALAACIMAVVRPGDEVVIFEPAYDAYRPLIAQAGGVVRAVPLTAPDWRIEPAALEAAIGPRTRALLINDPLNPAARAFSAEEIALVARACVRHDLVAICDEVWEHVLFDGRRHHPLINQPGMAERTAKIGSAGKIFSMTGWKVGFVIAGPQLIEAVARVHQFLTFTTPPGLQTAVAEGLAWPAAWFAEMRAGYQASRDRLEAGLAAEGFTVLASEGTYFSCVDLAASGVGLTGAEFCRRSTVEFGVAAIPLSSFFLDGAPAEHLIRLCFAKFDDTLDRGIERLARAREAMTT